MLKLIKMSSIIGGATGTLVARYLPFDSSTNIALGMASGQIVTFVLDKIGNVTGWIYSRIGYNHNVVRIHSSEKGKVNPIYKKMEEYVLNKYVELLVQCNLEPIKGEVMINLRDACFRKPLEIIVEDGKKLYVQLGETNTSESSSSQNQSSLSSSSSSSSLLASPTIVLYSYTMSVTELRTFVSNIAKLEKKQSATLTVYRAIMPKKGENPYWDSIKFLSNKTVANTIVSSKVQRDLFDDIEWFMQHEKWYGEKGVDYKRGYLLYGVPGCGKSSSIKAIANKYKLPIFNLDLETIQTNSQLIALTNDILCEVPDKPYILTIEDFDRHEMFASNWRHQERKHKVTMQCLLNVIDGIVESHGRILIITCNNKDLITNNSNNEALIRPGRVDKMIEFGYVDNEQASTLINNYYGTNIVIPKEDLESNITPADLIKRMQSSSSIAKILRYVCVEKSNLLQNNPLIDNERKDDIKDDNEVQDFEKPKPISSDSKKRKTPPKITLVQRKKQSITKKQQQITKLQRKILDADKAIQKISIDLNFQQADYDEAKRKFDEKQLLRQQQLKQRCKKKQNTKRQNTKRTTKKPTSTNTTTTVNPRTKYELRKK